MSRKITQVIFKEGVGKGSYKSFDIKQPTLNTGAKIEDIRFTEEPRGVLVQWKDHHAKLNTLLVPWGNIKSVELDSESMTTGPVVEVKPNIPASITTKKN
jgi:hypothetical protein